MTPGLFLLSLVGVFAARRHGKRGANVMLVALLLSGFAYLLIFRNAAYIHHYYKAFLVPALSILAALAWTYTRRNPKVRRFARPAIDALVLTGLLTGAVVWGISHHSGQQPQIQAIIDTINADVDGTRYAVFINADGYRNESGYNRVIEFYTLRPILWDIPPEDAESLAAEYDEPFAYIYCAPDDENADMPSVVDERESVPVYGEVCRRVTW